MPSVPGSHAITAWKRRGGRTVEWATLAETQPPIDTHAAFGSIGGSSDLGAEKPILVSPLTGHLSQGWSEVRIGFFIGVVGRLLSPGFCSRNQQTGRIVA